MNRERTKSQTPLKRYIPKNIRRLKGRIFTNARTGMRMLSRPIHAHRHRYYPRVLQNSIPKSGTHLLTKVFEEVGYRVYKYQPFNPYINIAYEPSEMQCHISKVLAGEYFTEHLSWKKETEERLLAQKFKIIFIYRDPRATAVSWCHHLTKGTSLPFREYIRDLPDIESKIIATLDGIPNKFSENGIGMCSWPELYDNFLPWYKAPAVFSVSYEDLVGSRGGGSDEKQLESIEGILSYLGHEDYQRVAGQIAGKIYSSSATTFRKGQIDSWRSDLSEEVVGVLDTRLEKQMKEWNYVNSEKNSRHH